MAFIKDGMKRPEPNLTYDPKNASQLTEEEILELQRLQEEMLRLQERYADLKQSVGPKKIRRKD